jgi:ribosomal protein S18 acetylase RimI-like enzyme
MAEGVPFEIVHLTPDDWEIYRELRLAALTHDAFAFGSTLEREQRHSESDFRERLQQRASFAARLDNHYVGLVGVLPADENRTGHLISMWVSPAGRCRGIGGALVRAVLEWAQAEGCERVKLWVTEGNEPAKRLYARNGFVPTGENQAIRPGEWSRLEYAMECAFEPQKFPQIKTGG